MSAPRVLPVAAAEPAVAAAVLSVFDLDWIAPDPTDAEVEQLAEFLATSCERVVDEAGVPRWRLRDDARARVLRDVPGDRLRAVLHGLPERPDDVVQRLLTRYLEGSLPTLDELADDELVAVRQLARWLGPEAGLPPDPAVQARLDRLALTVPLERLLAKGFVGREDVLAELRRFVEPRGPAEPFVLEGVGGAGKSTVLARFLLDVMARGDLAAYLNYDRGWLIDGGPWALLDEILRQVAAQDPAVAAWATPLRREAQAASRGREGYREIASRMRQSRVQVPPALLQTLQVGLAGRVLVIAVDTLEELARRETHHALELDEFLGTLRKVVSEARVVLAGRSVPAAVGHGGPVRRLGGLGEADAVHLLRLLAPGEDERVLAEIARRVEGNPLSLHLAADVLRRTGTSPVRMLAVGEGNVQGQLYARLLEHIRDPRVRAIAHPGLVVRRITPDVIRQVLALSCGIGPVDAAEAAELFRALRREATLCEPSPDGDGALVHRQDVRALMLPAIQQDSPATTTAIHEAAAHYYSLATSPSASDQDRRVRRREELYHRLMLKHERAVLDERWTDEAGRELAAVVDELPQRSQAYLVSRVAGLRLDPEVRAAADDDEWCHAVRPAAEARLQRHLVEEALEIVRERRGADGRALLPDLEIEALERLGRLDEALALAAAEYENAVRRGSHRAMREMLTQQARILERLRRWDEAAAILTDLARLDRERRARTDRLDEQVRTRELVVLTSLLRIARHQGRDDAALTAETVALAEATPPRMLVRAPSLLRDLGAEIGKRSPAILALATSTLADTSRATEEDPAVTSPGAVPPPSRESPDTAPPPPSGEDDPAWSDRFASDADASQDYL